MATWLNKNSGDRDVIILASAGDLREIVPLIK